MNEGPTTSVLNALLRTVNPPAIDRQLGATVPSGLERLPVGEQIQAQVTQLLPQGRALVQVIANPGSSLGLGELLLQANTPMRVGQQLTLEITNNQLSQYVRATSEQPAPTTQTTQTPRAGEGTAQPPQHTAAPPGATTTTSTAPQAGIETNTTSLARLEYQPVIQLRLIAINGQPPPPAPATTGSVEVQVSTQAQQAAGLPPTNTPTAPNTSARGDPQLVVVLLPKTAASPASTLPLPGMVLADSDGIIDQSIIRLQPGTTLNTTILQPTNVVPPSLTTPLQPLNPAGTAPVSGTQMQLQLQQIAPPGSLPATPSTTTPTTPQAQQIPLLTAIVIDASADGETILRTELGTVRVSLPQPPPIGTELQARIVKLTPPTTQAAGTATAQAAPAPSLATLQGQTTFPVALQTLAAQTEQLFEQLTQLTLPTADGSGINLARELLPQPNTPQTVARLLWFLSVLSTGDAARFVGQGGQAQLTELGAQQWTQQAQTLFTQWNTVHSNNAQQPWQLLPIPLFDGQHVHLAPLYLHKDGQKKRGDGGAESDATRFLVDLEFEALGRMQVDGLITTSGQTDVQLIIRHQLPMDDLFRLELLQIFSEVQDQTGLRGALMFQQGLPQTAHLEQPWTAPVTSDIGHFNVEA